MRTTNLLIALVTTALIATGAAGCGGDDEPAAPTAVTTPGVQPDGSYQVGTLPNQDAAAALKAAVAALPVAVSYDYRTLDESLAKAMASMTPAFADEFRATFEGATRAKATSEKAITSALVRGAGVVDVVGTDRVTCLIYLDQVLVSSKQKKPNSPLKVIQNRVRITMQKLDGAWKVAGVEPF